MLLPSGRGWKGSPGKVHLDLHPLALWKGSPIFTPTCMRTIFAGNAGSWQPWNRTTMFQGTDEVARGQQTRMRANDSRAAECEKVPSAA